MAYSFCVTGQFEKSAPIDLKMTLNTNRSKVPHLHVTTICEFQIQLCFSLQLLSVLRFLSHMLFWDKCTKRPKMILNTKRSKVPPYTCNIYPWIPNFSPLHSTANRFRVTGHFETSPLNDPRITLNTKRSNHTPIHMLQLPSSQISLNGQTI